MDQYYDNFVALENDIRNSNNLRKISSYFKNKEYVYVFVNQIEILKKNLKSIKLLVQNGLFEDAMTIFRKYIETYLSMTVIIVHPKLVKEFLKHNMWIGQRACNENMKEIRRIISSNVQGYLEYGYLASLEGVRNRNGAYTVRSLSIAANLTDYYELFRKSSNFVHNNLASTTYSINEGITSLDNWLKDTIVILETNISKILDRC
ncbi:DUF5677 domain-containing protein [Liberiplasma polymorphum]|uniref:DUF5677 domain-containing protein n=1 Tax=Liberiplasma polymorphum TaxID=3374570 RepID=UPI00377541B8